MSSFGVSDAKSKRRNKKKRKVEGAEQRPVKDGDDDDDDDDTTAMRVTGMGGGFRDGVICALERHLLSMFGFFFFPFLDNHDDIGFSTHDTEKKPPQPEVVVFDGSSLRKPVATSSKAEYKAFMVGI